ncbi:efflux RND transporter periplasmic adaptor subunit [Frateuria aurantia]
MNASMHRAGREGGAAKLPPLREEMTLSQGVPTADGAPTWMLHDPAANRFYQLSWPAFEMLSRWSLDDAAAIVAAVNHETTLQVVESDFTDLLRSLRQMNLLQVRQPQDVAWIARQASAGKMSRAMWLLKHYLMIRIPLWHPMPLLKRLAPAVRFAYTAWFWWAISACAILGLLLASRRWDEFVHTFQGYADLRGFLAVGVTLLFAKVLHEFAHAATAYRYGCRVPTMGVALLVMVPVLYTDTTEAWKVARRSQRLRIGAAGILAELALAALATLAWSLLPDGPLRAGAFLLATTTWLSTVTINASPFMRFDGYFLLSDWLDMPNLHERAFALARWWLRVNLFGLKDAQPEPFTLARRRFLLAFASLTWLYRLVVFFGISLLVFHTFFKLLGLMLFFVEIGWFIIRPLYIEMRLLWRRRAELSWNRQTRRTALAAAFIFVILVLPWRPGVHAPAVLGPAQAQGLYAVAAGFIDASTPAGAPVVDGQQVRQGQVLAVIEAPELRAQLHAAELRASELQWQAEQQGFDPRLQKLGTALQRRADAARQTVAGLRGQLAQATLRAPFPGVVQFVEEALPAGSWVPRGEHLFDIVGPAGIKGEAYVDEDQLRHVQVGAEAIFIAEVSDMPARHCRVAAIDSVNVAMLDQPSVASVYGGPVPASLDPHTHLPVPLHPIWRVRLDACRGSASVGRSAGLSREYPGKVTIGTARESYAQQAILWVMALAQSEAAF